MDITPKDQVETSALGLGRRITVALGIVVAAAGSLLTAIGGLDWIVDHLPMLGTGVASLVTGALTAYLAVRRMRVDRAASKAGLLLLLLLPLLLLSGCAVVSGRAGQSHYIGMGIGEKASSTLAGLNITETETAKGNIKTERGVGVDTAGSAGEADLGKILGNLLLLGLQSQGIPVRAGAASATEPSEDAAVSVSVEPDEPADIAYSSDGYGGAPAADGSGVYGSPTCSRCRGYRAAHPDVQMIDINDSAHRAALWSALRARGYTGASVPLPVVVTASAYTLSAK